MSRYKIHYKTMRVSRGALFSNGRILLVKRSNGPYSGFWELPGGEIGPYESYKEGLMRELKEEIGIDARVGEKFGTAEYGRKQRIRENLYMLKAKQAKVKIGPDHETHTWASREYINRYRMTRKRRDTVESAFEYNENAA